MNSGLPTAGSGRVEPVVSPPIANGSIRTSIADIADSQFDSSIVSFNLGRVGRSRPLSIEPLFDPGKYLGAISTLTRVRFGCVPCYVD